MSHRQQVRYIIDNDSEPLEYSPTISRYEAEDTLSKLKVDKPPKPNQINKTFLRDFADVLVDPLTNIFNRITTSDNIPDQWKCFEIILLHKKRDKSQLNNYRSLSLFSKLCKALMKIIKNRICSQLDSNQPAGRGFRKGYSTTEHIHIMINQVLEKADEYQIEIHLVFVDFQKAFDTVSHRYLWEVLREQRGDSKIRILETIYSNSQS